MGAGPVGGISAAEAVFRLNNDDLKYHPENSSSALYGDLLPGRDVKMTTTAPSATGLFRGYLTGFDVRPNPGEQTVEFRALGALHWLRNQCLHTSVRGLRWCRKRHL